MLSYIILLLEIASWDFLLYKNSKDSFCNEQAWKSFSEPWPCSDIRKMLPDIFKYQKVSNMRFYKTGSRWLKKNRKSDWFAQGQQLSSVIVVTKSLIRGGQTVKF